MKNFTLLSQEIHLMMIPYFLVQCGYFPDRTRMIMNFYFHTNFSFCIILATTYSNEITNARISMTPTNCILTMPRILSFNVLMILRQLSLE